VTSNTRNIGFILLYISIWLSLDSSIYNLLNIKSYVHSYFSLHSNEYASHDLVLDYKNIFFGILKSLRFISPYIIFVILFFLFRKDLISIKLDSKFKFVFYIIIFSFFLQGITPFFNGNSLLNVPFALISIILLINLIYFYNFFNLNKIFLLGLIILFFITTAYGLVLIHYLIFFSPNLNLYGGWPENLQSLQLLSNHVPRSSGISRSSLILMIPLSFYILVSKKLNYKFYTIYIFLSFLMLSTQSRISLFVYMLGVVVFSYYIFFVCNNNKLKKFLLIIILPIITWIFSIEVLSMTRNSPAYLSFISDKLIKNYDQDKYDKLIRSRDKGSFSSRRTEDWQNIIEKNQNYFLGYGVLGDRYLIDQTASSLIFYNYASGGIVSVFIFFILILRSIYLCIKTIFINYKVPDKDNYIVLSACFIVLFLIIRSLVESSFAVFGIDSLIFFSSYLLIEHSYKENNTK
tara:strand:- start:153 stop:1538 length:1386 start_codon:yes stop_codon:yes gene_type:complete